MVSLVVRCDALVDGVDAGRFRAGFRAAFRGLRAECSCPGRLLQRGVGAACCCCMMTPNHTCSVLGDRIKVLGGGINNISILGDDFRLLLFLRQMDS